MQFQAYLALVYRFTLSLEVPTGKAVRAKVVSLEHGNLVVMSDLNLAQTYRGCFSVLQTTQLLPEEFVLAANEVTLFGGFFLCVAHDVSDACARISINSNNSS